MSLTKRIKGDFTIESIDSGDKIIVHQAGGITIDGNLTVTGTQTSVDSANTTIVDNTIVLNSGETGAGVANGTGQSGITIDRGTDPNGDAGIRFNDVGDVWEINNADGTGWHAVSYSGVSGLNNIVEDLTPQLGGNLDVNGYSITSASNGDVVIVANGTGQIKIDQELSLKEQLTDETGVAGYNKLYAKATGSGGTGLYFANSTDGDELISKSKALIYSIIF